MRQTLARFIKLAAGYSPVTLLGPMVSILLTPLYTRVLTPADYGVVDVSLTLFSFLGAFFVLGLDQAISVYFFEGDEIYQGNLITTAITFVIISGFVLMALILLIARPLSELLFADTDHIRMFYLLAISTMTGAVYSIVGAGLRLRMNVKRVNFLGIAHLSLTVLANIFFVLVLRWQAIGIITAITITNVMAALLALVLARGFILGQFSGLMLPRLLKTGFSLLPGALSVLALMSIDRLLLTQYVSPEEIGLYSIANKLASMMYVLFGAAWAAWWPMALEMGNNPDAPRQYARMFEYFVAGSMFVSLAIGIFSSEILEIFTREAYVPAAPYVLVLLVYFGPLSSVFSSFQIALYVCKRTFFVSVLVFIGAVSNIILNLTLNPHIGVWGAIWSTVLAGTVMAITAYFISNKFYPVPYNFPRLLVIGGVYSGFLICFFLIPALPPLLIFKVSILVIFGAVILASGVITFDQIKIGLQSIRYHLVRLANNP